VDPSWIVSAPEPVSVAAGGEGELVLSGSRGRLLLRHLPPAVAGALGRLAHPGEPLGRLVESLRRPPVPGVLARFFYLLDELARGGFLVLAATAGGRRLATAVPTAASFALRREAVGDRPLVLSRFAYLHRVGDELALESPLCAVRVLLHDWAAASLVHALASPATPAQLAGRLPGLPAEAAGPLVALLLGTGMLTAVNDRSGTDEEETPGLRSWEFHDLLFHARSREGRHDSPVGATYAQAGEVPPPPAAKPPAGSATVELHAPDLERLRREDPPLARAMEARRSLREYAAEPIRAEQLGEFLYRVARVKGRAPAEVETPAGPVVVDFTARPYPAAGGLYELEVYPVVLACQGIERGLYHYDGVGHRLGRLSGWTAEVEELAGRAALAAGIPPEGVQVLIVLAARFGRVSWKYSSLAYALTLKDVGVLYQSMYLAATAMGLAPCALGVGDSDLFARLIGSGYYAETSVGEFLLGGG
jgi:SagB-type dehydrogenase family enzyme